MDTKLSPRDQTLPIAEIFTSIQGEGMYAGTKMCFVRLAGCNVGEYINKVIVQHEGTFPIVKNEDWYKLRNKSHSICTSVTGQRFLCDTNYHKTTTLSTLDIADEIAKSKCTHVLFTGGEPLLHDLSTLVDVITGYSCEQLIFHVETSGTKPVGEIADWCDCITCSPKQGFLLDNLKYITQLKFVVASDEELLDVRNLLTEWKQQLGFHLKELPVYISPVAPVSLVGELSTYLTTANELHRSPNWHPAWRLNLQQHKILGVR